MVASALACASAQQALALDFDLGSTGITGSLRTQVSIGATLRTQGQLSELIGKLNLPGREQFCEDKSPTGLPLVPGPGTNCTTIDGNAAYLALPGASTVNNDNGDLNYKRGDIANAAFKFAPRLQLTWGDFGLDLSGVYFYDPVNSHFNELHPNNTQDNNGFQPRNTPRPKSVEEEVGSGFKLLNAYVSGSLPLGGDRQLSFKVGDQVLSLGTSTLLIFNSLNSVNPPDANLRFLPGSDVRDVFRRVPLASVSTNISENLSVQGFYQYQWKPVTIPPIGSYYSTSDLLGAGDAYVMALFGKYREDPMNVAGQQNRTQGNAFILSGAGRTIYAGPENKPSNQGEYGVSFNYLSEALNNTSFGLTYLNLHTRFPLVSFIASKEGCAHNSTNQVDLLVQCQGFNPPPAHAGTEPLPIDTIKYFLDYPEDIHALGVSFSTNLGAVAWTGEVVFRPNQPMQIDAVDLGFAALQPVFPAQSISYQVVTIPGRRVASPDYVETLYRHNPAVTPQQVIRGYERLRTLSYDMSFLLLTGASDNPFGADQMTNLIELGAFQVLNMPSVDELQFSAAGTFYHHSAGIDSTGTPNPDQAAESDARNRLNPTYQDSGFATAFSYGYRILNQLSYENVFPGVRILPQVTFFHDIGGKSPLPTGEFVAGRKQATVGAVIGYESNWSGSMRYTWYFGAGDSNNLGDRDNLQATLSYDF